jgi:hypothetical protein
MSVRTLLHQLGKYAPWTLAFVVLVVTPLAYAGQAKPYVGVPPKFAGNYSPLIVMTVAMVGAAGLTNLSRSSEWVQAGREVGFSQIETNLLSGKRPELSGTINGWEVRIVSRDHATAFKAVFDQQATEGVVIGPADESEAFTPFPVATDADVSRDGLAAVESTAGLAEPLLSGLLRERMTDHEVRQQIYAGDLTTVYEMPDQESGAGMEFDVRWDLFRAHQNDYDGRDTWVGDSATVSLVIPEIVTDLDCLRREARTVVAVADAFERYSQK